MASYKRRDHFYQKAKRENFAARSVFKLQELQERFHFLQKKILVVDLGCSPGSWMQYISELIGPKGFVLGFDLEPVEVALPKNAAAHVEDILTLTGDRIREMLKEHRDPPPVRIDLLVSDLAPKLSGVRDADQARVGRLVEHVMNLGDELLKPGATLVSKAFQGRGVDELLLRAKKTYKDVKLIKPAATREGSREAFLVARGKKVS